MFYVYAEFNKRGRRDSKDSVIIANIYKSNFNLPIESISWSGVASDMYPELNWFCIKLLCFEVVNQAEYNFNYK